MTDPLVEKASVTLSDGIEREVNFRADQIIWLRRERNLDLAKAVNTLIRVTQDPNDAEKKVIDSAPLDHWVNANVLDLAYAGFRVRGAFPADLNYSVLSDASFPELGLITKAVVKAIVRDLLTPQKATVPNPPASQLPN